MTEGAGTKKQGLARMGLSPCFYVAGGRGFEPRFTESAFVGLPLIDPPIPAP